MPDLLVFDPDERQLLITLPFKAGVYVSHAEDEEGELDDEKEMRALEHCLKTIAKLHDDKPFIQDITRQILLQKSQWDNWSEDSFSAVEDAKKAMKILRAKVQPQEFKQYRAMVLQIAGTVARAYGEFGDWDDEEDTGFFKTVINKVVDGFSGMSEDDKDHPMNVSPAEESALSELSAALNPKNLK